MEVTLKKQDRESFIERLKYNIKMYWFIYLLVLPGIIHLIIFRISPIYGISVAFKDYKISKGILKSPWVGFDNFKILFTDKYFYKVIWNTVLLNIYSIIFGTAFTIFLALMLNEIKNQFLKKTLQTSVYFPNFVSWVIFAGIVNAMLSPADGAVNLILKLLGLKSIYFLGSNKWFRFIIVASGIIKTAGFGTIIYLASIAGINPEIYESASIDGAHRGQLLWHITLPRIKPTIAVMLIMSVSNIFGSNFEQIYNLYSPLVYETGDVLSTYMYRTGLLEGKFETSTALGLAFSVIGLGIVIMTNKVVNKMDVMGFF
ncbi:MAG TPA: ABC transporter permease subunit [Clostridiales bacterium]|nr:ABC transporter permease subunit [Clostridiales bacterium]